MSKFRLSSKKRFNLQSLKKYWPILIIVLLLATQVERFIRVGTILGYQVRTIEADKSTELKNRSGSIVNGKVAEENQKSIACEKFPADRVAKVLESEVERISGFVPDRTTPVLTSSCIYRTKGKTKDARTVAILYREQKDDDAAKKTISSLRNAKNGEDVKKLGDEAFFNINANQLTVRSKNRLITVTTPTTEGAKLSSKAAATEIAKIGL